jgi:hypothetical protein
MIIYEVVSSFVQKEDVMYDIHYHYIRERTEALQELAYTAHQLKIAHLKHPTRRERLMLSLSDLSLSLSDQLLAFGYRIRPRSPVWVPGPVPDGRMENKESCAEPC